MKRFLFYLLQTPVVIFLAGAIISVGIDRALGSSGALSSDVLLIFIGLFVFYSVFVLDKLRQETTQAIERRGVITDVIFEADEPEVSYRRAGSVVRSAEKEIFVISQYAPKPPSSQIMFPKSRSPFLQELETIVEQKSTDGSPFVYKRVIQSGNTALSLHTLNNDSLSLDPETLEHSRRILSIQKRLPRRNVIIELLVTEPLPSIPSVLIVDERYVFITLISAQPRPGSSENEFTFSGVLSIEDITGNIPRKFKLIFENICRNSTLITSVQE